jgi:hypothetical protein
MERDQMPPYGAGELTAARALPQDQRHAWRWIIPALFVCALIIWDPVGYVGGGTDDDRYLAGALCWVQNGPCLPVNHWEGRWPLLGPLALFIGTLGFNRIAIALPSVLASLACLILIKRLGDRFDARIGTAAVFVFAALPVFVFQVFSVAVESVELLFVLAGMMAVLSRRHLLAGVSFALAFQVRETSIAALLPAAVLLRKDLRGLLILGASFSAIPLIEFLFFYLQTGNPLYRRLLSVGHTAIPSSELRGSTGGRPFFNTELLRHWRYEPGFHVHWLVDGFVNLFANLKTGFLYTLSPLLLIAYRSRLKPAERGAAAFLIGLAFLYSAVLIYVLAVDPKARAMFVPTAALALAFAIIAVRAWNLVLAVLMVSIAVLIALTVISQPRHLRFQRAAEAFEARFPGQIETAQPGYFAMSSLRDLPPAGSGRPYLLVLKDKGCGTTSTEDVVDLRDLELRSEARANFVARAIGNRASLCLFKYRGTTPKIRPPSQLGPSVRLTNQAVID